MNSSANLNLKPVAVGRYHGPDGTHFLPVSSEELSRAREAAQRVISSFAIEMGRHVLLASLLDEVVQCLPLERAIMVCNLVVCSTDSSSFDAARVESVIRRFNVAAVGIIGEPTLDGLEALGFEPGELLRDKTVWARPEAYARLAGSPGVKLLHWYELGPATAAECARACGAHIDRIEWEVEEDAGELVLHSRLERCVDFSGYRTGFKGRIDRSPCACGNADPRILPLQA